MKHSIIIMSMMGLLFSSCADKKTAKETKSAPKETMEKVEYVYKDGTRGLRVEITSPPQRALFLLLI